MYRFVDTGLTLAGKVWSRGDVVKPSDDAFEEVDGWFKDTKGIAKNSEGETKYLIAVQIEEKKEIRKKSDEDEIFESLKHKLKERDLTLEEAQNMDWRPLCKKIGPQLGKLVRDYDKPNDKK